MNAASSRTRPVIKASRKTTMSTSAAATPTNRMRCPATTSSVSGLKSRDPTGAGARPAARIISDARSPPRKSSVIPVTTTAQRGSKQPRPTTSTAAPSILPVLCVYSDQNQLVRKEQFRAPSTAVEATVPASRIPRKNNENLNRSNVQPTQPSKPATLFQSTVSSMARVGSNLNSNNGAKRTKLSSVPRSSNPSAVSTKAQQPALLKVEKVNLRRNENGIPQLPARKTEMTSAGNNHTTRGTSTTTTATRLGGRPTSCSSSSSNGDSLVRPSVSSQLPTRVEVPSSQSINALLLGANRPLLASTCSQSSPKRGSPRSSSSKPSPVTSVLVPPAFHSSRAVVTDNPDLKKQSQGSTAAVAVAADSSYGAEIIFNDAPSGLETAGSADVVDSSSSRSTSARDLDTNYVVFEYPIEVAHPCVMGTHPDAGYSSEKSPDEETTTKLPDVSNRHSFKEDDLLDDFFQFVSNDNIFKVTVQKTVQGLGLSVTGGVVSATPAPSGCFSPSSAALEACSWPGLIRIKKIFPHGAAWQTNKLAAGDVLLSANGQPLTGCTNYEALELLRCTPRETELEVCRIPKEIAEKMGIHSNAETPTNAASYSCYSSSQTNIKWLTPVLTLSILGEFEISMTKVNGSLGFTLRKEDESILGHYIRSLVKEPAISDGRILPGDKIISVNGVDMSAMSHAEAVAFLRRCPETVTIRLFRDSAITPISPLSPTEPETGLNRPRPLLRQEAQDLLHDLAVRKQGGSRGGSPAPAISGSPCSPRRRRLTKTPSPDLASVVKDRFGSIPPPLNNPTNSTSSPPMSPVPETDMERDTFTNSLDVTDSNVSFHTPSNSARVIRPDFLDLNNSLIKKQRFMFTPPNGQPPSTFEERQSGDGQPETPQGHQGELDATEYHTPTRMADSILDEGSRKSFSGSFRIDSSVVNHSSTMDCPLDDTMDEEFVSFHSSSTLERYAPQGLSDRDLSARFPLCDNNGDGNNDGKGGLVKWKGVVLTPDEEYAEEAHLGLIQTIELNKGWNSRLGFSVGCCNDGQLFISVIYDDSVAAKDGRLQVGDRVLRVNGEKITGCSKDYVIDILRKTRGPVAITVRKTA